MQEASFNGLLKTLLYIVAFYYIFKFLFRLFFPIVIKKVVKKAEEQFKQQYQNQQNQPDDFDATTQKPKSDKPKETKKVGDYIDYEEIE